MSEPEWVQHAVWWHVYPLGFVGAEQVAAADEPVHHRLERITAWLDHAVRLGASGLALGPVFASETHGYDTVDHYRVDARLGDDADLDALLSAAHERGLRVLFDGVFNHVARSFGRPEWFRRDGDDLATFEGHDQLVALDHANPEVVTHVVDVMCHWLDRGIDGWRLDAAYAVPPAFWAEVAPRVRERHPDAYLVGEVIHGDYGAFVRESGLDSVTQYELWKAVWSALNDANLFELAHALGRHSEWLAEFVPLTFVGNHDVTRIASRLTDERHLPHALAVLFCAGGTPSVYAGDELGLHGVKEEREGGDDAVRPEFPARPGDDQPDALARHQELIGVRRRHAWLHRATTTAPVLTNTHAVFESTDGEHRLSFALNLADDPVSLPVAGELLAGAAVVEDGVVHLGPHGWAVVG